MWWWHAARAQSPVAWSMKRERTAAGLHGHAGDSGRPSMYSPGAGAASWSWLPGVPGAAILYLVPAMVGKMTRSSYRRYAC